MPKKASNAPVLSRRAVGRATLARQMLLEREKTSTLDAIERLIGVQAQLPRPPFVGLWSRVEGFRREDLADLLRRREVVRATSLRTTLHLMSARDYVALRGVIAPVLARALASITKARGATLDVDQLVAEARPFFAAEPRDFEAVRAHLAALHPDADDRAMGYAIRTSLPLVQVPTDDAWSFPAQADFALADAWLGTTIDARETAPDALVRRYLAAYGPASVADAQAWTGLGGLRPTFDAMKDELRVLADERGRELFDLEDAPRPGEDASAPLRFLPEWDGAIVARADERFVAAEHRQHVFLSALRVAPTVLIDGVVAATWKIDRKKTGATLTVTPFDTIAKKVRPELEQEADALLAFHEPDAPKRELKIASL
ncbi:winged helix DNA-binding domain-containing protein [Sandaracinus amylolyticus]|uniref:winged helix DNA-binding domain-containing protein n=1 Tax=Sandaracinus amylolyticus TaxID=927083 RepID=UPI001F2BE40A|nr:winged helix DNA-binding domain-containing protein [Sandaracinus amylolyticus]UJR82004.1 Winged helix DNA-binding domain-containing protein [Sandaracinus amylolyticus]